MSIVTDGSVQGFTLEQRELHVSVGRRDVSRSLRMTPFELPVSSCRLLILIVSISSPVEAVLILVIEGILTGPREVLHRGLIPLW
jgi:hypothetical protein